MEDGEREPLGFSDKNLTLLEHYLIGSRPVVRGEIIDVSSLMEGAVNQKDKEALVKLSSPVALLEGSGLPRQINEARAFASLSKVMKGAFQIFTDKHVVFASREGIEPYLEIGSVDGSTGLGPTEWKVWLADQKGEIIKIPGRELLEMLELTEEARKFFRFEIHIEWGYCILRLKTY